MRKGNFFIVQNEIFDQKLSLIEFYVYCYLLKCNNRKNGCYPSRQTISKACGISGSSVGAGHQRVGAARNHQSTAQLW